MVVSTLRVRRAALKSISGRHDCSQQASSYSQRERSLKELCPSSHRQQDRRPTPLLTHTHFSAVDEDDEIEVDNQQQEPLPANFSLDGDVNKVPSSNVCDDGAKIGVFADNRDRHLVACTSFCRMDTLLGMDGCSEDNGAANHPDYAGNDHGIIQSQVKEEDKQAECSFLSGICRRGECAVNLLDGFQKIAMAASDGVYQLDMAVHALLQLHTPQPTKTYIFILQACTKFKGFFQAQKVHAHITSHGAILSSFLSDYLVMTLAKCGAVDDARRLYLTSPHRTVFSTTALISAYVDLGQAEEAVKLYYIMQEDGMEPDSYTFVGLLKAYESLEDLEAGRFIHIYACKKGLTSIPHVCNSLIGMYGKCGALPEAENLFHLQGKGNIVSWTIMLSIYAEQGQAGKTLWIYRQMHEEGLIPDQFAYVFALQACGVIAQKEQDLAMEGHLALSISKEFVQALHADALWKGYACDVFVGTALLTAYAKCGTLVQAEQMFNMLTGRNLVTWNAMLSAYLDKGQEEKALLLYMKMQQEGVDPEQMTFVIAFQACGNLAEKDMASLPMGRSSKVVSLQILRSLHADFCITERSESMVAATALLRSYAKCAAISEAEDIFNTLSFPDLVSWNAMLTSYVEQSQGENSICLYVKMQEAHVAMDDATMITVLLACSETGNTNVCKHLHFCAVSINFDWILEVAATLVHAYGSCSMVVDAQLCFDGISSPDAASWNACIADHAGDGSFAAAFCIFEDLKLAGCRADEVAFTSILVACMHAGLVKEGIEYFESIRMDFGINPDWQHYSILVDVFARAGDFKKIESILEGVQVHSNMNTWLFLLGACRTHSNFDLAKQAFDYAVGLQPKQATAYVLMSNIYATGQLHMDG